MNLAGISRTFLLGCLLWSLLSAQQTTVEVGDTETALLARLAGNDKDAVAYTRLYQMYMKQGRPADAEKVFARAEAAIPPAVFAPKLPKALAMGDFCLAFGRLEQALRLYREGAAEPAADKPAYLKRQIEILMRQGKRTEATEFNAQILKENPDDTDARGLAASFLLEKGDINGALAEFQGLAVRAPDNPYIHFYLGRALAARGDWEGAKGEFTKSFQLRPEYLPAPLALAQLQAARGEFDDAWKTAAAVLELDGGNHDARLVQASVLMGQKKLAECRQMLGELIKAYPESAVAHFQLGAAGLAEKKYPEAEAAFRQAYQLNPADTRGLMGMVETALAQNRPEAAMGLLKAEAEKAPNRLDLQVALGNTAVRTANYDLAIAAFRKVLSEAKEGSAAQGDLYLRLGEAYRRKGENEAAVEALQRARQALPNNAVVAGSLGLALDSAGRQREAGEAYEATLKLDPNSAIVLNNYAFLLAETGGDLGRALAMAQRARQLLPNIIEISDTLGWVYLKMGKADDAIQALLELVTKSPNRATFRYHLAMAYQKKGDTAAALKEARAGAEMRPSEKESRQITELLAQLGGGK